MAWQSPTTWSTGQQIQSTALQQDLVTDVLALRQNQDAAVELHFAAASGETVPIDTDYTLNWTTTQWNVGSTPLWAAGSASAIRPPVGALYSVAGVISWASTTGGYRQVSVYRNTTQYLVRTDNPAAGGPCHQNFYIEMVGGAATTDLFTVVVRQNALATLALDGGASRTRVWVRLLGIYS